MADLVDAAEREYLEGGRDFWEREVATLLARVDNIERNMLGVEPTTCQLRRLGKQVVRKARGNPYLVRELGLPETLTEE